MQGLSRFKSGAYTEVRDHFGPIYNTASGKKGKSYNPF
jgi:hypothetical protein